MFADKGETAPYSIEALEDYPSIRIIRLRGPIDQTTVTEIERFRKWVEKHSGYRHKHILLDFRHVTRIDTAAVAEIIQAVSFLKSGHFRLGAIHVDEKTGHMLHILKVEKLITLYKSESEALDDLVKKT